MGFGDILKARADAKTAAADFDIAEVHIDDVEVNEAGELELSDPGKPVESLPLGMRPVKPRSDEKERDRLNALASRK